AGINSEIRIWPVSWQTSTATHPKRSAPKDVPAIVDRGIRYTVPHFGALHGKDQNGGYVQAWDVATGKLRWDRIIYRVPNDSKREGDMQDVFITELRLHGSKLLIRNERQERFEMDLASGQVRTINPSD